jgi:hypothetical protein
LSHIRFDKKGIITELFPAGNSIPETRNKREIVQDFYNHDKETNKPIQPISEILFNKDQQPLLLLKIIIKEIKNKYFSDNQSINNNITLSEIEVELLDLLEVNVPESKPKKSRPKDTKNKQYLPPKSNKKKLTRTKTKQTRQFV